MPHTSADFDHTLVRQFTGRSGVRRFPPASPFAWQPAVICGQQASALGHLSDRCRPAAGLPAARPAGPDGSPPRVQSVVLWAGAHNGVFHGTARRSRSDEQDMGSKGWNCALRIETIVQAGHMAGKNVAPISWLLKRRQRRYRPSGPAPSRYDDVTSAISSARPGHG